MTPIHDCGKVEFQSNSRFCTESIPHASHPRCRHGAAPRRGTWMQPQIYRDVLARDKENAVQACTCWACCTTRRASNQSDRTDRQGGGAQPNVPAYHANLAEAYRLGQLHPGGRLLPYRPAAVGGLPRGPVQPRPGTHGTRQAR